MVVEGHSRENGTRSSIGLNSVVEAERVLRKFGPQLIIELGTQFGGFTKYLVEWFPDIPIYTVDQVWMVSKKDAQFIVNISASPFYAGKTKIRRDLIAKRARENHIPVVYVNLVGGQDDLVFDGGSYVFNRKGNLIAKCKLFEEDLLVTGLQSDKKVSVKGNIIKNIHGALVLGIRDYVRKNGFNKVVIGLSGGIDSALTAALAVEALGAKNVLAQRNYHYFNSIPLLNIFSTGNCSEGASLSIQG